VTRREGRRTALLLAVAIALAAISPARAVEPRAADSARGHALAGERLAELVAVATGVPISPLLGVSGLGAYRWWRTPEPLRPRLPWFARPVWWGTGLALALLFALNTTIGGLVPGLKKPMDWVEQFENQFSAVIASPVIVFEAVRLVGALPGLVGLPAGGIDGLAALGGVPPALEPLATFGAAALALAAYAVVFLAFHAIQVLIALSPSTILDLLLRGFRLSMLGLVAMAASVHPYVGAAFGLLILLIALLIAGWSFRLTVFGVVLSWDWMRGASRRLDPTTAPLVAFTSSGLRALPVRTLGRVEPAEGERAPRFTWRRALVLGRRSVELPWDFAVRRGLVSPTLFAIGGIREPVLLRMPPRWKGHEEPLCDRVGAREVQDGRFVRGVKAAWGWLVGFVRGEESAV